MLKAQAPPRSRPDGFEPYSVCQQHIHVAILLFCTLQSNNSDVRFIVTCHHPKMYGEFSGHSGDGFVFVAGVVDEPAKGIVGIAVFLNPYPGALDERTTKLRSARFEDGAISGRLA